MKVSIKGTIVGGIVDVTLSFVLSIPITIVAVSQIDLSHVPKERVAEAIRTGMNGNVPIFFASAVGWIRLLSSRRIHSSMALEAR